MVCTAVHYALNSVNCYAGWEDVRLLAPKAELKLLVCGGASAIDAARLSYLGEALRALLLMEMRLLEVRSICRLYFTHYHTV